MPEDSECATGRQKTHLLVSEGLSSSVEERLLRRTGASFSRLAASAALFLRALLSGVRLQVSAEDSGREEEEEDSLWASFTSEFSSSSRSWFRKSSLDFSGPGGKRLLRFFWRLIFF